MYKNTELLLFIIHETQKIVRSQKNIESGLFFVSAKSKENAYFSVPLCASLTIWAFGRM